MTRRTDNRETREPVPAEQLPAFTPVPRRTSRHDGWTEDRQRRFIDALADTGSVKAAARAVNMSAEGAYQLRRQPGAQSFREAWQTALDLGVQRIEDVAMDRALNGVEMPVYSYGQLVGTRTSYNDRLLMFMLRNRAPERFTDGRGAKGLGGLNAIGKMEMERLKKQWRAEWEAERAQSASDDEDAVLAAINAKLSSLRDRQLTAMSPRTRAAYEEYRRLEREDEEAGYCYLADPEHPDYIGPAHPGSGDAEDDPLPLPPPGWGERKVEEESEDEYPRWRRLTDDGWD